MDRDYLLVEHLPYYTPSLPLHAIVIEVCEKHGFSLDELKGDRRSKSHAVARQEFYWRAKKETDHSLPAIAKFLGGRDHTTILHGIKRHEERMKEANGAT